MAKFGLLVDSYCTLAQTAAFWDIESVEKPGASTILEEVGMVNCIEVVD